MRHASVVWLAPLLVGAHVLEVRGQCPPQWLPTGAPMNDWVNRLIVYNGALVAGGQFTAVGGVNAERIAAWNGTTWSPLGGGVNAELWALAVYNGDLIAGGWFTTAGGAPAPYIARWDGTSWSTVSGGTSDGVYGLTVYNNELIAGGGSHRPAEPARRISRSGTARAGLRSEAG